MLLSKNFKKTKTAKGKNKKKNSIVELIIDDHCYGVCERKNKNKKTKTIYYFCPLHLVAFIEYTHYSILDDQITGETDTTDSQKKVVRDHTKKIQ